MTKAFLKVFFYDILNFLTVFDGAPRNKQFLYEILYFLTVFDGAPRNKQQIDAVTGSMTGEAKREANKAKVYYGLLKEPDINIPLDDEEEEIPEGADKPKVRVP